MTIKAAAAAMMLAAASTLSAPVDAQQFPLRPIRLVVGFAPGGATDIAARAVAQKISETIGQPMIVDNRPGASGNIAADSVAKSAPDGYTVYLANATIAIPSLFVRLPFDVTRDFAPIALIGAGGAGAAAFLLLGKGGTPPITTTTGGIKVSFPNPVP